MESITFRWRHSFWFYLWVSTNIFSTASSTLTFNCCVEIHLIKLNILKTTKGGTESGLRLLKILLWLVPGLTEWFLNKEWRDFPIRLTHKYFDIQWRILINDISLNQIENIKKKILSAATKYPPSFYHRLLCIIFQADLIISWSVNKFVASLFFIPGANKQ